MQLIYKLKQECLHFNFPCASISLPSSLSLLLLWEAADGRQQGWVFGSYSKTMSKDGRPKDWGFGVEMLLCMYVYPRDRLELPHAPGTLCSLQSQHLKMLSTHLLSETRPSFLVLLLLTTLLLLFAFLLSTFYRRGFSAGSADFNKLPLLALCFLRANSFNLTTSTSICLGIIPQIYTSGPGTTL